MNRPLKVAGGGEGGSEVGHRPACLAGPSAVVCEGGSRGRKLIPASQMPAVKCLLDPHGLLGLPFSHLTGNGYAPLPFNLQKPDQA